MSQIIDIQVPDIGDYHDVPVIELLVAPGSTIAAGDAIATLESDKATLDVPAPRGGVVRELLVRVGERVSAGSALLRLDTGAAPAAAASATTEAPPAPAAESPRSAPAESAPALAASAVPPAASAVSPVASAAPPAAPALDSAARRAHASPSVRRLARELGVDLAQVPPGAPKGRITREDVIAHVKTTLQAPARPAAPAPDGGGLALLPWPQVDFARFGPVERRPRSRVQQRSAANLHRNWVRMPHVTNFDEADITALEAFRQQINREQPEGAPRLTLLAFIIKAAVHSLQAYPAFNSSLDGDTLVEKRYWHIGFAADTPGGLVVPVVRDADRKTLLEIARECGELARQAREGMLRPEQMQGGSFTVSSLGGIGGTGFTPIINAPEVAILGLTRSAMKPVWDGTAFQPRLMQPLCLSWDHRAVDGAAAARFLVHLARGLADLRRLMV
jgi:pyruvate dehydrogenase E2 component (dihydrolipoamide acetyltransferase)